jgi:hypothetical protein
MRVWRYANHMPGSRVARITRGNRLRRRAPCTRIAGQTSDSGRRSSACGNHARPSGAGARSRYRRSGGQQAARDPRSVGSDGSDRPGRVRDLAGFVMPTAPSCASCSTETTGIARETKQDAVPAHPVTPVARLLRFRYSWTSTRGSERSVASAPVRVPCARHRARSTPPWPDIRG